MRNLPYLLQLMQPIAAKKPRLHTYSTMHGVTKQVHMYPPHLLCSNRWCDLTSSVLYTPKHILRLNMSNLRAQTRQLQGLFYVALVSAITLQGKSTVQPKLRRRKESKSLEKPHMEGYLISTSPRFPEKLPSIHSSHDASCKRDEKQPQPGLKTSTPNARGR